MTFKSIKAFASFAHTGVGTLSSAALYTVPAGKTFFLKEALLFGDSVRITLYVAKSGAAAIPNVATDSNLATRIVAMNNDSYYKLAGPTTNAAEAVDQVAARNTVLEAGDKIFAHSHEAGAATRTMNSLLSGDEF